MYKIIIASNKSKAIVDIFNNTSSFTFKNYFYATIINSILDLDDHEISDVLGDSNVYFLDLTTQNHDKMLKLSKKIRKINPFAFIIYISDNTNYLSEYLSILPFAILPTSIKHSQVLTILSTILSLLTHLDLSLIEIKTKDGTITIDRRLITFVEYENHYLFIHTKHGDTIKSATIRTSFKSWMKPLLNFESFISPHKSYLVNMDHVRKISNHRAFIMTNGSVIPIANQIFSQVKTKYLNYIRKKYVITN